MIPRAVAWHKLFSPPCYTLNMTLSKLTQTIQGRKRKLYQNVVDLKSHLKPFKHKIHTLSTELKQASQCIEQDRFRDINF